MEIDQGALNAWFDKIDRDIDQLPVDAKIEINGTKVTVVPGETGTVIDRESATAEILGALRSLEPVAATLPTEVGNPAIEAGDLDQVKAEVSQVISEPVTVRFEDDDWKLGSKDIAPYLGVELVLENGVPAAKLSVDTKTLAADLRERFSEEINRKPVDAVFSWDDGLIAIEDGQNGAALRSDAFASELAESFLNGHGDVEIPVVVISPEVDHTKLDTYGIDTLLGGGDSNFAGGSWARDENIRVSTELLNHTLVRPGETFSFNRAIGEITYDKGYQEAQVVVGEAVGRDVGGGVCQVSTTVFRAALNSGMPITEWHPHSYRLSNYERDDWGPGFDASILQYGSSPSNWADFQFENYTDSWLLVQAYVWDTHVYVDIYGSGDGRSVDIEAWEIGGNAFGFTRTIVDPEGNIIAQRDFETYFL
jgi:vancomycin resistance protein YoaR